jgi:hypothetical protein
MLCPRQLEFPSRNSRRKCMFLMDRELNSINGPLNYHPLTTALIETVHYSPLPASLPESPVVAWNDDQATEMADAIAAMEMAPTLSSHFSSSRTLLGNPPPTPSPYSDCPTKSSSQVATEFAQQVVKTLKSVNAKQEPPPPAKPSSPATKMDPRNQLVLRFRQTSHQHRL